MASKFAWTDGGAQTFTTKVHVQSQVPGKFRTLFPDRSIDGSVIEVISIGSGVNEVAMSIRHENDDTGLRDLRDALARGISMTFTPDTDVPATTFTVTATTVGGLVLERQGRQNIWRLDFVLARLDGGAFAPDLP